MQYREYHNDTAYSIAFGDQPVSKALDRSINNPKADSRLSIEEEILSYIKAKAYSVE